MELTKDPSDSESSTKSPEIRAFFDLVDRENHRLQLLSEKTRNSEKPSTKSFIIWQPSFEVEDFKIPMKGASNGDCSKNPINALTSGSVEGGSKEEKKLDGGLKRPINLLELAPLLVSKRMKEGSSNKVIIWDLNKEAESIEESDA